MTDIKIDKKIWDQLSSAKQASVTKRLIDNNVIKSDDTIIATSDEESHLDTFQAFRDCGYECDQEATATFAACMKSPGTDPDTCRRIAQATFFSCMENCVEDDDDDDDDDEDEE